MARSLFARWARRFGDGGDLAQRRAFLRASVATGLGLMLAGCASEQRASKAGPTRAPAPRGGAKRVLVVGAGLGGLACAHELAFAGVRVEVLEARNRVGGRTLSFADFVPGATVDGGGELIGSNHPLWLAYAERFGLELASIPDDNDLDFPVLIGGELLSSERVEALYHQVGSAFNTLVEPAQGLDATRPFTHARAAEWDALSLADWLAQQRTAMNLDETTVRTVRILLESDNGVALERVGLLAMLAAVAGGGGKAFFTSSEDHRCAGGAQALARAFADRLPEGALVLGTPVASIARGPGGLVRVTTRAGVTLDADGVVLACPVNTWSRIDIDRELLGVLADSPPQMGQNAKLLLRVREPVWRQHGLAADAVSDGALAQTWEATRTAPQAALRARGGARCLAAFGGGPALAPLIGLDTAQARERTRGALEALFPGLHDATDDARWMDWTSDEWTRGGYCFAAPGEATRIGPRLTDGEGPLHIVGEHASYAFPGYMEGALQSGVRVARALAGAQANG